MITIDGPSGSGKGTISVRLAEILGYNYLDSGLLYRLFGHEVRRRNIPLSFLEGSRKEARDISKSIKTKFPEFFFGENAKKMMGNTDDLFDVLRSDQAAVDASNVARLPVVRQELLDLQRTYRLHPGLIADGRDMGTVVFPDADLKIFLTASVLTRARRRYKQLKDKGMSVSLDALAVSIEERDRMDSMRKESPLRPSEDADVIDSSELGIDQVLEIIESRFKEKLTDS